MGVQVSCVQLEADCKSWDRLEMMEALQTQPGLPVTFDEHSKIIHLLERIESANEMISVERFINKDTKRIGDLSVPRLGKRSQKAFEDHDVLVKSIQECGKVVGAEFGMTTQQMVEDLLKCKTQRFSIALADPLGFDCPLVYVSRSFENLTEYPSEFCLGRSCRFLQPTVDIINDAVNLNERRRMRDFCGNAHDAGSTIVCLLLNERRSGIRFWNLLKMVYIKVSKKPYIVALQTHVDCYMPGTLRQRTADPKLNHDIVEVCRNLLDEVEKVRGRLSLKTEASLEELRTDAWTQLDKLQKLAPC